MNKKGLVNYVAEELQSTKKEAKAAVDAVLTGVVRSIVENGSLRLTNFGAFEVKLQSARKARNPKTGQAIEVPEKHVVRFKAGKELKELVLDAPLGKDGVVDVDEGTEDEGTDPEVTE